MFALAQIVVQHTQPHQYGFLGINGLVGLFIGLFILVVICVILFKIFRLLMVALGVPAPWSEILYWFAVLIIFLIFLHFFGLY
jgi:divalent metal cation (Fe/Co/Zn/Cd) transporter